MCEGTPKNAQATPQDKQCKMHNLVEATVKEHNSKKTNSQAPAVLNACHVCKEEAGKHCYYGGQSCTSCRSFFRRSVQSGSWERYFCTKQRNCELSLKTRKKCQFCRYKACLNAGMKANWVLNEEEKENFMNARRNKEPIQDKNCKPKSGKHKYLSYISEEEIVEVNEYINMSEYFEMSKVKDMESELIRYFCFNNHFFEPILYLRIVAFKQPLTVVGQSQLQRVLIQRSKKCARKLKDFQNLSQGDQNEVYFQTKNYFIQ